MQRGNSSEGRVRLPIGRTVRAILCVGAFATLSANSVFAQEAGFDYPFDHPLQLNWPNVGTRDTAYGPDALQWTAATRVLAIQPLGRNWDMIIDTNGGPTYVSQMQDVDDVDFVLFEGGDDARPLYETTARIYRNGDTTGMFYSGYVRATAFDQWDGENGFAEFHMLNFDLVQAKRLYLKAGFAYRFDIDRASGAQKGFASLMRSNPDTRIQPRSQALAEFSWEGQRHDDFVFVPEEGWYTLVVVQQNGDAYALGNPSSTQVIPRGDARVPDNTVRINVSAE
jgi:hypothetical protein